MQNLIGSNNCVSFEKVGRNYLACKAGIFCIANDGTYDLPPSWTLKLTESWGESKALRWLHGLQASNYYEN